MMNSQDEVYGRMVEIYTQGEEIAWDDQLPPPEIIETVSNLIPGRALDLGSGYGRASIYLTQQGWQVEAVEFVELAVAEAKRRAQAVQLSINFHHGSVLELDFLDPPFDLAIDVGCAHALDEAGLKIYHAGLKRLLRPQALYLLFARLQSEASDEDGQKGMHERKLLTLFADGFKLNRVEKGETAVSDGPAWASGWLWFEKLSSVW